MATLRSVPESDRTRLRQILRYAFAPQQGPVSEPGEDDWPPTLFEQRGLYDDGELVSTCKRYSLSAWVREGVESIGGLGAVATPPEYRRRGYIRELCRQVLPEFEANGEALVALWPFQTGFYANLGWATVNDVLEFEFPPAVLPAHESEGEFRLLDSAAWERLRVAEQAHNEDIALALRRSEQWWRERTLSAWTGGTEPYIYGYERNGTIAGYLVYTVADDEHETLQIKSFGVADEEATRALLNFLGTHGAQIERIALSHSADRDLSLFARVDEPRKVDCERATGPMARLTSADALELLTWPAQSVSCPMTVTDPLGETETIQFSVEDGAGTVLHRDSTADGLTVDIGTLTQLVLGSRSLADARKLDDCQVGSDVPVEELEALFEPQAVALEEFF